MESVVRLRISSGYIGAGSFVLQPGRAVVGTAEGVECIALAPSPSKNWEVRLGSRCVGVALGSGGVLFASCVDGLYALSPEGREMWGAHSLRGVVHSPVPFRDGVLITTKEAVHYKEEWPRSEWRFDFSEGLGRSVASVRVVNLFAVDAYVVCGAVDYDTGVGRVFVLYGKNGRRVWMSDPGPLSEVFPAGRGLFVWSQTGYGKFETRLTRLDGHEIWRKDMAGVGCVRPDGSIAFLVGSNESPAWDDFEYQQYSPGGKPERRVPARGRCLSRPVAAADGSVFFVSSLFPREPSRERSGDTRFFRVSQEVVFQHLMGIRLQPPVHEILVHRLGAEAPSPEVVYRAGDTYSFADLQFVEGRVALADGTDIVVIEA